MKSDFETCFRGINFEVQKYREDFLKRKNINGYKKTSKNTPLLLDKIINKFDRQIKGIPIFLPDVKKEYLTGLERIFGYYYIERIQPKASRKEAYISYLAENYIKYGRKYKGGKTFKEFISSGLSNKYR